MTHFGVKILKNSEDELYFLKGIPMSSDDPIEYDRQIRKGIPLHRDRVFAEPRMDERW
jgi:hypothetical protein